MSISAPSPVGVPVVDQASEPAAVRRGGPEAKKAYETGLGFEQMLVSELTQTMTDTISGSGSSDPSAAGSASGSSSGSSSSDSGLGAYSSLLGGALSSSIMSAGGTGVAMQIAESIDPRLADPVTGTGR